MSELYHHGVVGMKWGVRRYQNEDGSLTDAGQKRYNKLSDRFDKNRAKAIEAYRRHPNSYAQSRADAKANHAFVKLHKFMDKVNLDAYARSKHGEETVAQLFRSNEKMQKVWASEPMAFADPSKLDPQTKAAYDYVSKFLGEHSNDGLTMEWANKHF